MSNHKIDMSFELTELLHAIAKQKYRLLPDTKRISLREFPEVLVNLQQANYMANM